ncbi:MAG: hypothetical protein ACRD4Q_11000 [Candidatus Acidiferrales bacterium]
MKSSKRTRRRLASTLALGAFALAMTGSARTANAQECRFLEMDCTFCGGEIDQVPCCDSVSCFFVEVSNGNCNRPGTCEYECPDGSMYDNAVYCTQ